MTDPRSNDRPQAGTAPTPPAVDAAPPLAPEPDPLSEQSPWWSAPSGKPFNIPDFAHEFSAALLAWLFPAPQAVPVRVKARRRA
jgi:hypothetical protein